METRDIWEYSDEAFEEFSRRIQVRLHQPSTLWSFRDAVFYALTYRQVNEDRGKRHRLGLFSWLPWLIKALVVSLKSKSEGVRTCSSLATSHFLFYGWHSSHYETLLPLLIEKSKVTECCVWAHSLRESQLNNLRAMQGVDVIDMTKWQPNISSISLGISKALTKGPQTWFHVRNAVGKSADYKCWSSLYEMYFELGIWQFFWNRAFKNSLADRLYVTSESSPIAKVFIDQGIKCGASIYHICHGLPHAAHAVTRSTDLVPFTEVDARWFKDRVPPTCRVHSGGNPRMNAIKDKVGPPRKRSTGDQLHVLFFAQGVETPYTKENMKEDFSILKLPESLARAVDLRIRIHPRETVMSTKGIVDEVGLAVSGFSSGPLEEDLAWSDVCATSWSTALLEAIACGRPAYWVNARNDRLARTGLLMDAGYGRLVRDPQLWADTIQQFLQASKSTK